MMWLQTNPHRLSRVTAYVMFDRSAHDYLPLRRLSYSRRIGRADSIIFRSGSHPRALVVRR